MTLRKVIRLRPARAFGDDQFRARRGVEFEQQTPRTTRPPDPDCDRPTILSCKFERIHHTAIYRG